MNFLSSQEKDVPPQKIEQSQNATEKIPVEQNIVAENKDNSSKIEEIPESLQNIPPENLLKEAKFFSEISKEYWDKQNYEGAKELLDKAYAYLLAIKKQEDKDFNKEIDELRLTISKRIQELHAVQQKKVTGIRSEIPLIKNEIVERELRSFQGSERDFFLKSYQRSRKYMFDIEKSFREEGLPEELAWLPLIESGFNTKALSPARALGLWQFIPSTGARFGLSRDKWVDERMDPEKSTKAAIAYLKGLHNIFGDWTTALAAYNCGEGLVLRTIRDQKINYLDNFWDLYQRLPEQTARYVPRFLAVIHILKNPEKYGFNFDEFEGCAVVETEKVVVDRSIHLRSLADKLKIPYQELAELNPELKLQITPDKPYELRVPASEAEECKLCLSQIGSSLDYVERLSHIDIEDSKGNKKNKKGDKSISVSNKTESKTSNPKKDINAAHPDPKKVSINTPVSNKASNITPETKKVLDTPSKTSKSQTHKVLKGDTLYSIAKKNNVTVEEIMRHNKLKSPKVLRDGMVLQIP